MHSHCYFYRPQYSCGKVMFLHLSVSHSVHGGVSGRHPWADTSLGRHLLGRYPPTPLGRHSLGKHPWAKIPGQTPPGRHPLGRHPFGQTPLWADTPKQTPKQTPPPAQCMLGHTHTHNLPSPCWDTHPPPCPVHAAIHPTPPGGNCSGRYASYWNAFL